MRSRPSGSASRRSAARALTARTSTARAACRRSMQMLTALKEGYTVALTADVPKVARVCGLGIVKLASMSGRPIYPVAIATSHRIELRNWDRTAINLPFGRAGGVAGAPVHVPRGCRCRDARKRAPDGRRRRSTLRPRAPMSWPTGKRGATAMAERLPFTLVGLSPADGGGRAAAWTCCCHTGSSAARNTPCGCPNAAARVPWCGRPASWSGCTAPASAS